MTVCLSAIPSRRTAPGKTNMRDWGAAWIASNFDFQACEGQRYEVRDVETGATFKWYVVENSWGSPRYYLGNTSPIWIDLQPGDELQLEVDLPDDGEDYMYWDTLIPCEQ
ncbi:hypothetical protein EGT74_11610 [Chitinophaga lutea]|uniref:Uncharacterized protein n=2 Tax=Chitinophaga lutea TaxID=2488634 RepID=A0A3N4Q4G5_9BACT|nr:hypothetical protein EGT74_11610 [Chitinophaga lutea]